MTSLLTIDAVTLTNCGLSLAGTTASVRLTGEAPELRDCKVVADATAPTDWWGVNGAIINLHECSKAVIDNVEVTAGSWRKAVGAITRADYTRINALRTYTAWGILFNDTSFIDRSNIEGVDYTGQSIGTGLTVTNSEFFGPPNPTWTGDAIEINAPTERFSNVIVSNCRVHKTYTSNMVGIGFGFAQVDHVTVSECYIEQCPAPAGAYHAEFCSDVKFVNNTAVNCRSGFAVEGTNGALVSGNRMESCWEFSLKSQSSYDPCIDLTIVDNTFIGLKTTNDVLAFNDIIAGNAKFVSIVRNKFLGMGQTGLSHINFVPYGSPAVAVTHAQIKDNIFANTTGLAAADLIFLNPSNSGLRSSGNDFTTYLNPATSFISRISAYGVSEDYYRGEASVETAVGMRIKSGGTPVGWVAGLPGAIVDDVVNGVQYRYDSTAAAWAPAGSAYSNPVRMGNYRLWVDASGLLRIKDGVPTSNTDGTVVGTQA